MQEEEWRRSLKRKSPNSGLALMDKGKQSFKVKQWEKNKCKRPKVKSFQGTPLLRRNSKSSRDYVCYYCGKRGHFAKNCVKGSSDQFKQRRDSENYVDRDEAISHDFRNLKLFVSNASLLVENNDDNSWFIDFGASNHMSCKIDWFDTYHEVNNGRHIYLGDNRSREIKGYGNISVMMPNGQGKQIQKVLYVPRWNKNLISISTITNEDLKVEFVKSHCLVNDVQDNYKVVAKRTRVGALYKLDVMKNRHQALASTRMSNIDLWHQRYGHLNHNDLMLLQNKLMVEGLPDIKGEHFECEGCALGKQHREEFPMNENRIRCEILELMHTDVFGPMQSKSLVGAYYFLIFIDDRTRYTWVYFIRNKGDVFEYLKEFKCMVEKKTQKNIKILRLDKGGEYTSGAFFKYCKQNGIMQQFTVPNTPQQNGVAERKNRKLVECAHSMLKSKGISNSFWVEAINTIVYLKNKSPTKYIEHKTPVKAFYGFKPKVSHLRIFGCKAFGHIPKEDRRNLYAKAIKYIFTGYYANQKAYKM